MLVDGLLLWQSPDFPVFPPPSSCSVQTALPEIERGRVKNCIPLAHAIQLRNACVPICVLTSSIVMALVLIFYVIPE